MKSLGAEKKNSQKWWLEMIWVNTHTMHNEKKRAYKLFRTVKKPTRSLIFIYTEIEPECQIQKEIG